MQWDDDRKGYWVTLYDGGEPRMYLVDSVYGDGAGQGELRPNWASVYEAALVQHMGSPGAIDGDYPSKAFRMLTGNSAQEERADIDEIREALAAGKPVCVGSQNPWAPGPFTIGTRAPTVTAPVENPPGQWTTIEFDIADSHAYSVLQVDEDSNVYLANPWGPQNAADGGGVIKLTPDQFQDAFPDQSIGGNIPRGVTMEEWRAFTNRSDG